MKADNSQKIISHDLFINFANMKADNSQKIISQIVMKT
ncbi:hypothetical protein CVS40_11927 [Lucilia cuprina]|nr:hypothetical protein CVS40_11927 [Lucilia cuprina]